LPRKQCRHYRSNTAPEYGLGWLRCLDCGKLRNTYHPNARPVRDPEYRTGPVTDQNNQGNEQWTQK
jgi:hypothetical protein